MENLTLEQFLHRAALWIALFVASCLCLEYSWYWQYFVIGAVELFLYLRRRRRKRKLEEALLEEDIRLVGPSNRIPTWKCRKCGKENSIEVFVCRACGEIR